MGGVVTIGARALYRKVYGVKVVGGTFYYGVTTGGCAMCTWTRDGDFGRHFHLWFGRFFGTFGLTLVWGRVG